MRGNPRPRSRDLEPGQPVRPDLGELSGWNFYAGGALDESDVTDDVQRATGTPPRTFAAWCQAHAAEFSA
ncbi:hypothetical protein ACPPVO_19605 [Dactylosporangium sp. McL0621]|uniref:hypothetical protein n=1 Tax=Dactylosporangium sp. McL0621 TaxID=3415678 RepID=UPI003CF81505